MIDLHSHSTASDGSLSPTELLKHAQEKGLSCLALTDHDTLAGLEEANIAANQLNIRFINGAEFEAAWDSPGVFHVLALNFDRTSPTIVALIPVIQKLRRWRNTKILEHMAQMDIRATVEDILPSGDELIITRPHFADYLVKIGLVKDRKAAFDKYLAAGKPFYEKYPGLPLQDIVTAVHEAGGLVSVAHPLSLYVSWTRLEALMVEWKTLGIDAIETWHPSASWKDAQRMDNMTQSAGLSRSAGSDFHGTHRPDRILGKTLEERHSIDDSFLSLFDRTPILQT